MATTYMVTTVDNPYNPFTDFDAWYAYDERAGYHTTAYLARIVMTSHDLSEPAQETALDLAVDEIVQENILGIYRKISSEDSVVAVVVPSSPNG